MLAIPDFVVTTAICLWVLLGIVVIVGGLTYLSRTHKDRTP